MGWLNRTVLGIGLASLFSDWSHEIATTVMPAFLATMGAAAWLRLIEGVSDGLSSFAKMTSGYYTDRLKRRKPIAIAGYVVTALGTASFGLATSAWHVLVARSLAWLGRGVRTPVRKALLAGSVTKETYGRAFGFERMMDTVGAIVGPASAFFLLQAVNHHCATLFALTLIPGLIATGPISRVTKNPPGSTGRPSLLFLFSHIEKERKSPREAILRGGTLSKPQPVTQSEGSSRLSIVHR